MPWNLQTSVVHVIRLDNSVEREFGGVRVGTHILSIFYFFYLTVSIIILNRT